MSIIYHVTTWHEWEAAERNGFYETDSLETEGFIHCSTEQQLEGVIERYFGGVNNVIILAIDTTKLKSPLKYELASSIDEQFPHIYGKLNIDAVQEVVPFHDR